MFCPVEHGGSGENVWEMLPAALHGGQQQFSGQLLLGHLWDQRHQGAGSALPGRQVLLRRGHAGRDDVRLRGHELQRLDAKDPPDQVWKNGWLGDGGGGKNADVLMISVPLLSSKQIPASADAEQSLHSQDGRKCVRQSQHVSAFSHSLTHTLLRKCYKCYETISQ